MGRCLYCDTKFEDNNIGRKRRYCSSKCKDLDKRKRYKLEKKVEKNCKLCGALFYSIDIDQQYCGQKCATLVNNNLMYKYKCISCDKTFLGKKGEKYCSIQCRKTYKKYEKKCDRCGENYFTNDMNQRFCSVSCANKSRVNIKNRKVCMCCGTKYIAQSHHSGKFCSRECFIKMTGVTEIKNGKYRGRLSDATSIKRAKIYGVKYETIDPYDVFERDRWKCGICGGEIDKKLSYPEPMSASLDHIKPLSKGGTHTINNVQASHLRCNISKNNRGE